MLNILIGIPAKIISSITILSNITGLQQKIVERITLGLKHHLKKEIIGMIGKAMDTMIFISM